MVVNFLFRVDPIEAWFYDDPDGGGYVKQKNVPPVGRDQIIGAALAVIDRDGLDRFNLAGVAGLVGITTASLYYYFRDKGDLLASVARHLLEGAASSMPAKRGSWEDVLIATSLDARRSILRHPRAAALLLQYPPRHLVAEGYERSLRLLEAAGVSRPEALRICQGLESITWGSTLLAAAALSGGLPVLAGTDRKAGEQDFIRICRAFLTGYAAMREATVDG